MAIKHSISSSRHGIAYNDLYYRLITTSVMRQSSNDAEKFNVNLDLAGYATTSPDDNTQDVDFIRFTTGLSAVTAMSGPSWQEQCYQYAMTQMSGSTAV